MSEETKESDLETGDPLDGFFYDLLRDHLSVGTVERLVGKPSPRSFPNPPLARLAKYLRSRLEVSSKLSEEENLIFHLRRALGEDSRLLNSIVISATLAPNRRKTSAYEDAREAATGHGLGSGNLAAWIQERVSLPVLKSCRECSSYKPEEGICEKTREILIHLSPPSPSCPLRNR